jgi:S1-C subfamily serine protease
MKQSLVLIACLAFLLISPSFARPKPPITLSEKIDVIRPSVVHVTTTFRSGVRIAGTGFVINKDGVVITARHVVIGDSSPVDRITIDVPYSNTHDNQDTVFFNNFGTMPAQLIATDELHDIAILKPNANPLAPGFKAAGVLIHGVQPPLLPRAPGVLDERRLKDGEPIFISGYPLDLSVMVTTSGAIASSSSFNSRELSLQGPLVRSLLPEQPGVRDIYWADIQANHGNSGGPVFSADSTKIIGMQVAIAFATAEYPGGGTAYGLADDGKGKILTHDNHNPIMKPIKYNSGLTEIIPADAIGDLLRKNHVAF